MSDAPKPPPIPIPAVRVAMHLKLGATAQVVSLEMRELVQLCVTDTAGKAAAVNLTLAEAAKVAEHLSLTCRRVRERQRRGLP